jgi:hypothetical protein
MDMQSETPYLSRAPGETNEITTPFLGSLGMWLAHWGCVDQGAEPFLAQMKLRRSTRDCGQE